MLQSCFRLKINLAKLELVPVGNVENVDGLVGILSCEVFFFAFEVFWSFVKAFYNVKYIWDGVIEKIVSVG
jgi:hypothetical protein